MDSVIERIKKAVGRKAKLLFENQKIPASGQNTRPDLVFDYRSTIYIVDVTCPFENTRAAFDQARDRKIEVYTPLVQHFKTPTNNVEMIPFVVGALGSWDPTNDTFMSKFVSRSYLSLFRKLCVSDVLRWSRDIYIEHLSGVRQFDDASSTLNNDQRNPPTVPEDNETLHFVQPTTDDGGASSARQADELFIQLELQRQRELNERRQLPDENEDNNAPQVENLPPAIEQHQPDEDDTGEGNGRDNENDTDFVLSF